MHRNPAESVERPRPRRRENPIPEKVYEKSPCGGPRNPGPLLTVVQTGSAGRPKWVALGWQRSPDVRYSVSRRRSTGRSAAAFGVLEAVALALGLQDVAAVAISMDGRGRAPDNAFAGRLWRTAKYEEDDL